MAHKLVRWSWFLAAPWVVACAAVLGIDEPTDRQGTDAGTTTTHSGRYEVIFSAASVGTPPIQDIALEGDRVYFTVGSSDTANAWSGVLSVSQFGGYPTIHAAPASGLAITADSANVYWSSTRTTAVYVTSRETPTTTLTITDLGYTPTALWRAGDETVWLGFRNFPGAATARWAGGLLGNAVQTVRFVLEAQTSLVDFAFEGGDIFAATESGSQPPAIVRIPADGEGGVETLSRLGPGATSIAADDTRVYWMTTDGGIYGAARGGDHTPVKLASDVGQGSGRYSWLGLGRMMLDDTSIYFATDDAIKRVSKTGGGVDVLVSDLDHPRRLCQDDDHVYWLNGLAGPTEILRTNK